MKKKVPYKYYLAVLIVTMCLAIINAIGCWMTWFSENASNVFGYVSGCFTLAALIICAVLAFLNERILARKQGILWIAFFVLHITCFVIIWFLSRKSEHPDNAVPALFTVLLAALVGSIFYILIKDKIKKNQVGYSFPISRESLSDHPDEIEVENASTGKVFFKKPKEINPKDDDHEEDKTSIVTL